jgi:hypothetical protein
MRSWRRRVPVRCGGGTATGNHAGTGSSSEVFALVTDLLEVEAHPALDLACAYPMRWAARPWSATTRPTWARASRCCAAKTPRASPGDVGTVRRLPGHCQLIGAGADAAGGAGVQGASARSGGQESARQQLEDADLPGAAAAHDRCDRRVLVGCARRVLANRAPAPAKRAPDGRGSKTPGCPALDRPAGNGFVAQGQLPNHLLGGAARLSRSRHRTENISRVCAPGSADGAPVPSS